MRGASFEDVLPLVAEIVSDVRKRGDEALLDWTERLDGERPELRVPADQLRAARLQPDELSALQALAAAVAAFCEPQRPPDVALEAVEGVRSERRWVPLASVGVYVPGGRASYPSSLVMAAVPARVAGVERIAVVTPKASEATLAAAHALGIEEVYAVGGAQAVAALAFGTETIAPVDKIVGPGNRWVTAAKLLVSSDVAIDLPAGPSEVVLIADASADPARCAADLLAQSEHGPDSEAILLSVDPELSAAVGNLVAGTENVAIRDVSTLDEALGLSETYAPEHLELWVAEPEPLLERIRNVGTVFVRTSAVVGDYASGATHVLPTGGLARGSGGLGLETFLKPIQLVRAFELTRAREIGVPLARLEGLPLHAAALESRVKAQPLPDGFRAYEWSPSSADVASRHGLRPEQILRYDQNTPPAPGVPQVPLAESFARLQEYPDGTFGELREAAAGYCDVTAEQVVVGAGADELILLCARTYLGPGGSAAIEEPTYGLYRIATELAGASTTDSADGADLIWVCNPNNPTGELRDPAEIAAVARAHPAAAVVVDEAYYEYAGATCVPLIAEQPNLIVLRTLSKAFGFASLRVGWAVASPEAAAELELRRPPASVSGPAARIGAAALREPRIDVTETIAERERMRTALVAAGHDCPEGHGNFVFVRSDEPLGAALEELGLIVRVVKGGIRITPRRSRENDVLLAALGAVQAPAAGRAAYIARTSTETSLRVSLELDGAGRSRCETGVGFLDHLLTLWAFHAGVDLELLAGGDLDVDEHHTVEDVLAALGDALAEALGDRQGIARYGAATVPMDEASATAAVDLVRRPHAEISLAFTGERVGGLALSLLPHALERFAMQAGCTIHVTASGADDHHVAEAAFKALGRALREACAPSAGGVQSTKGLA